MKQTTQNPNNPSNNPQISPQQPPVSTPHRSNPNIQNPHLQNQILGQLTPHIITQVNSIQRCSSMTLIETPAVNNLNSSYLQQIDARIKSISKIILWTNDDQQVDEDQAEDQLSGENLWVQGEEDRDSFGEGEILFKVDGKQKSVEGLANIPLLNYTFIKRQAYQKQDKSAQAQKKSCNCKKTQCLKLYCDCFRENRKCQGCSCVDCHNTQQYSQQRKNAVLILTDRNPSAFKPKIQVQSRYHSKGCNCKKSNCMKKYCECYQAGLKCGDNCKCEDCKNCVVSKQSKSKGKRTLPFNFKLKKGQGPPIIIPIGASIEHIITDKNT